MTEIKFLKWVIKLQILKEEGAGVTCFQHNFAACSLNVCKCVCAWVSVHALSIISSLPLLISLGVFGQQIHKSIMVLSFMPWFTQLIPPGLQQRLKRVAVPAGQRALKALRRLDIQRTSRHAAGRQACQQPHVEREGKKKKRKEWEHFRPNQRGSDFKMTHLSCRKRLCFWSSKPTAPR